jgi:signal transduction histidine kinase/CheY-like chemotaxis protein
MRFRARKNGHATPERGIAGTAARRIARQELIQEAVQFLLASANADRVGVWMECSDTGPAPGCGFAGFRGVVADRNGETTPSEWERLSPEAPLPLELLNAGKSVEQDLGGAPDQIILGALVEMRRAVWVPVEIRGRLRGVLLAGLRKKHGALPVRLLEAVSADLALAAELDEERRLARERLADITVTKEFLDHLAHARPMDAILTRLVGSCTDSGADGDGLGAVFAALRLCPGAGGSSAYEPSGENGKAAEPPADLRAPADARRAPSRQSGDPAWLHALESQPLAGILQQAREAHGTVIVRTGEGTAWPRGDVAQLAAIGLEAGGETLGVLVAGFRYEATSRAAIARLELRAGLAAMALVFIERNNEAARHEARQQTLLQASSVATILVDADGAVVGLSRGARELLGEEPQQSRLRDQGSQTPPVKFIELFRAREHQRVETWLKGVQANSRIESGIEDEPPQVELQNGSCARLRFLQPGGGLLAVSLEPFVALDCASRRDRAEAQLFSVIEWLEEGVVLFDARHGIQAMNSRFAQIAGLAPEETGGIATLQALIVRLSDQTVEPEKFAKRWHDLAHGGLDGGVREEIQLLRPIPRVLERTARPVLDTDGRRIGRVEIYRDLTAQRVFQSKLLQTEKLAALGQMVTGVAHELSNPLTSILGYAQRLFLRSQAEGQSDEIRQIFEEAERASAIVRQLLMNARESRPERRRVSLNQLVLRTVDLQKISLAAEKVNVELDLDEALPFLIGDTGQMQQVLMNLIGNARQAIEQRGRGGTIWLRTKCLDSGRRAQLEVRDDGPGVPPGIVARIFDPFFTTKPAGIGTGLGLAIVLGVVREHGGQVQVASPPGGGAIFSVEFPAVPAQQTHTPVVPATGPGEPNRDAVPGLQLRAYEQRSISSGDAALPSWTGARVLVVEDEPTVARLISDVLEDEGFHVDALLDGHEALERAARESYDLVICDMKMPGLDGQRFYEMLASTGNSLYKRFLFVTGDVLSSHTYEFLERHRLPHVAKPFRVEELTEKVRGVLLDVRPGESPSERANKVAARTNVART